MKTINEIDLHRAASSYVSMPETSVEWLNHKAVSTEMRMRELQSMHAPAIIISQLERLYAVFNAAVWMKKLSQATHRN